MEKVQLFAKIQSECCLDLSKQSMNFYLTAFILQSFLLRKSLSPCLTDSATRLQSLV